MSESLSTAEREKFNPLWMRTENDPNNPLVIAGNLLSAYGIELRREVDQQDGHLLLFVHSEAEKKTTTSLARRRDFQLLREAYQGRGVMEVSFLRDLSTIVKNRRWDENDTASLLAYYYQNATLLEIVLQRSQPPIIIKTLLYMIEKKQMNILLNMRYYHPQR